MLRSCVYLVYTYIVCIFEMIHNGSLLFIVYQLTSEYPESEVMNCDIYYILKHFGQLLETNAHLDHITFN